MAITLQKMEKWAQDAGEKVGIQIGSEMFTVEWVMQGHWFQYLHGENILSKSEAQKLLDSRRTTTIEVSHHANAWIARFKNDAQLAGIGNSKAEALGNLLMKYSEVFGVTIEISE